MGIRPPPQKTTRFYLREGKQAPACCHVWCRALPGGSGPSREPGVRPAPGVTRWGAGSRPRWAAGVGRSTLASPCASLGWGQAGRPAGVLPAPAVAQSGPQRLGVSTGCGRSQGGHRLGLVLLSESRMVWSVGVQYAGPFGQDGRRGPGPQWPCPSPPFLLSSRAPPCSVPSQGTAGEEGRR